MEKKRKSRRLEGRVDGVLSTVVDKRKRKKKGEEERKNGKDVKGPMCKK